MLCAHPWNCHAYVPLWFIYGTAQNEVCKLKHKQDMVAFTLCKDTSVVTCEQLCCIGFSNRTKSSCLSMSQAKWWKHMQLCKSFHLRPVDPHFPLGIEDDEGDSCSMFTPIAMSSHPMEPVIDVAVFKRKLASCKKKLCHASPINSCSCAFTSWMHKMSAGQAVDQLRYGSQIWKYHLSVLLHKAHFYNWAFGNSLPAR